MRLMLLFIVFSLNTFSQDSIVHQVGVIGGMNRNDFTAGIQYSRIKKSIIVISSAEFGVRTTFFQTRLFPRIGLGIAYNFISREKFNLGPFASYYYSGLKLNKAVSHLHQWNEFLIGNRLELGSKWKFTNQLSLGLMNERFYSQLTNKKTGVTSLGFYGNVGIAYVL